LGISPKRSNTNPAASRELICLINKYLINEVRCLGLNELAGFKLSFPSRSHFVGTNASGTVASGTILATNDSTALIEYSVSTASNDLFSVRYVFAGTEYPSRISKHMKKGHSVGQEVEIGLEQLEFGPDPLAAKGYFGLDFRNKPQPLATLILYTNNHRFIMNRDGTLIGMDGRQQPAQVAARQGDVTLFFVILLAGSTGFCLIRVGGKAEVTTPIHKSTNESTV
jgi:hypothetical protein